MPHRPAAGLLALAILGLAAPAAADPASLSIEALTDLRVRGLSWSAGKPAVQAFVDVPLASGLSISASAATLRGTSRHASADALVSATLGYRHQAGPIALWTDIKGHGFPGGNGQEFAELRAGADFTLGPAQLAVQSAWAPSQRSLGGSNLHLAARLSAGIPGTALTLSATAGRSSGTVTDAVRANRLRPGGAYEDFRLDADYVRGPFLAGISLTTTTIDQQAAIPPAFATDLGTRLLFRLGYSF